MQHNNMNGALNVNFAVRQRGASLLEGIAYLGVAAIVILGAIALLMNAFGSAESNRLVEEVTAIRTSVRKLYMGQSASYGTGSLNANLVSARAFPTTLAVGADGTTVRNAWNGNVTVTGNNANFTVSYQAVPRDVCINALAGASGWIQVQVTGSAAITAFPVTPAAATTACAAAANEIVWTAN